MLLDGFSYTVTQLVPLAYHKQWQVDWSTAYAGGICEQSTEAGQNESCNSLYVEGEAVLRTEPGSL